ncbi:unnamed protein product [Adineta steineri]|uniref:Amine oxidase domain-containing protein n=3 Tax=Adineta steineri TaxID=433720 RepID=A0A819BU89_9BILA|nr:unnamed protein product [Adineta steineri]
MTYSLAGTRELSSQMIETNKFGLPQCIKERNECQQIGIVGAGAAGLYCGILLAQAGHTVRIYEASNRAGGRISTYRDPNNPSIYMSELGAMRLPLDTHSYLNTLIRERYKLNITPFANSNDNAYAYVNGIFGTMKELRENPIIFKFNMTKNEQGKTSQTLWLTAFQPILQTLEQGGWLAVKNQWDSYSIDSYLKSVNMSRDTINYINILRNYESGTYCSILEVFRAVLVYASGSKFYGIDGGNDLLIQAMITECQSIDSDRCSIMYSMPVIEVQLNDSNKVQLRTKNETIDIVDTLIVATTAPAANLIKFEKRIDFVDKYRALRQIHYMCSTKVLLNFNVSWWYTQENINGGQSLTDLHVHSIYYPYIRNNQTNGGTIIAAYNLGTSSLVWQSLFESDIIELVLQQLIRLHRSSSNMRDYFQGGKVQHWCGDPYAHGAFARFIPFQETELFHQLQTPVSKIHFIGEHTTLVHGWVEGAIISAVHGALSVTRQKETIFDVVIIGGNLIGLSTAIFLSLKQPNLRIVILEKNTINDYNNQLHIYSQEHFRQIFDKEYLVQLAKMSFTLWQQLEQMSNLSSESILNTNDGFLFLRNPNMIQSTIEDNWASMKRICENLDMNCEYLNNTQLRIRYPMFTLIREYEGIFHNQSGYINITTLMMSLLRLIDQSSNITIREHEELLSLQLLQDHVKLITNRGILHSSQKVILIPDSNVKNISRLFNFDLNMRVLKLPIYYFRRLPNFVRLPNGIVMNDQNQQENFSSFSIVSTSDYIIIKPTFIQNVSNFLIDSIYTETVLNWVSHHLNTLVNVSDYYIDNRTYLVRSLPDNKFVLDYVPRTNKRILMQVGENEITFVPVLADILSDMVLFDGMNTSSKYTKYFDIEFSNQTVAMNL